MLNNKKKNTQWEDVKEECRDCDLKSEAAGDMLVYLLKVGKALGSVLFDRS